MKCSLGISDFLGEISSLSQSIVFLYFFTMITEEGFLISPCYSSELCIQMGLSFLSPLPFTFLFFPATCKASSDNRFAFLFLGDGLDHCLLYKVMNLYMVYRGSNPTNKSVGFNKCLILPIPDDHYE